MRYLIFIIAIVCISNFGISQKIKGSLNGRSSMNHQVYGSGLVRDYKMDYSISSFFGEPIVDVMFTWEMNPNFRYETESRSYGYQDLSEYPDLQERYNNLKPENVKVTTGVYFSHEDNVNVTTSYYARSEITLVPDLVPYAGSTKEYHVPGSPSWLTIFNTTKTDFEEFSKRIDKTAVHSDAFYHDLHKNLFLKSKSIWLSWQAVEYTIAYDHPEQSIKLLFEELERRKKKKKEAKKKEDEDRSDDDRTKEEKQSDDDRIKKEKESMDEFWDTSDSDTEKLLQDSKIRKDYIDGNSTVEELKRKAERKRRMDQAAYIREQSEKREAAKNVKLIGYKFYSSEHKMDLFGVQTKDRTKITEAIYLDPIEFIDGVALVRKVEKNERIGASEPCRHWWYDLFYCIEQKIDKTGKVISNTSRKVLIVRFADVHQMVIGNDASTEVERRRKIGESCLPDLESTKDRLVAAARSSGYIIEQ